MGNHIGDEGAIAFSKNTTLYFLDVAKNKIGVIGLSALEENKNIKYISTWGNGSDSTFKSVILNSIAKIDAKKEIISNVER